MASNNCSPVRKYRQIPENIVFTVSGGPGCSEACCSLCSSGCQAAIRARYWKLLLVILLLLTTTQLSINVLYNRASQSLFTIARRPGPQQNFDVLDSNSSALLLASAPASAEVLITAMESRPASDNASKSVSKMGHKSLLSDELPKCPPVPPDLVGRFPISTSPVAIAEEERKHPELLPGGHFMPPNCSSRHRVAIIIPYRAREAHLGIWLRHMHSFLQTQQLDYTIFVVEQAGHGKFNRAQLMNVGALESSKLYPFQCYIFHDVDLLPEDNRNIYSCPQQPRHMSVAVDIMSYKLPYKAIFGGVSAISVEHFKTLNGFSNKFWGWGGEDDDMSNRINHHGLYISRYPANIARYTMLSHQRDTPNPHRFQTLYDGKKRFLVDGASSCRYQVLDLQLKKLYTWVLVELHKS